MENSPTLCFACFERKRNNSSKKSRKIVQGRMSRHNFRILRHNFKATGKAMLQQEMIYHNKEVELKLEVKIVATFHNFVAT